MSLPARIFQSLSYVIAIAVAVVVAVAVRRGVDVVTIALKNGEQPLVSKTNKLRLYAAAVAVVTASMLAALSV
jgi:adenylate kinase